MNLELNGKRALVTASTGGIGRAIAERLHLEGASVILNGRTQNRIDETITAFTAKQGGKERLTGFAGDLAKLEDAERLIREFPEVDILVNNYGVYNAKPVAELTAGDFSEMFHKNVVTGSVLAVHYLSKMKARNWGRILFIASESGANIPVDMIPYGVSKAAQIALARGLAESTAGTRVTVNSVLPGPTRSEGVSRFLDEVLGQGGDRNQMEKEFVAKARPTSLIQRFADPDEVAPLVAYLASPLAAATNGAAVRVEGGLLRSTL